MSARTCERWRNSSAAGASSSLVAWSSNAGLSAGTARLVTGILASEAVDTLSGRPAGCTRPVDWNDRFLGCRRIINGLTQIGRCDARIASKHAARAFDGNFSGLQHAAIVGDLQRGARVLLDQQNCHAGLAQRGDDAEDFPDDQRR